MPRAAGFQNTALRSPVVGPPKPIPPTLGSSRGPPRARPTPSTPARAQVTGSRRQRRGKAGTLSRRGPDEQGTGNGKRETGNGKWGLQSPASVLTTRSYGD